MRKRMIAGAILCTMLLMGDYVGSTVYALESKQPNVEKVKETQEAKEEDEKTEETEALALTEEELAKYYEDSVFVGDSIMVGFRNYCSKKDESFVKGIQFLAVGSYSAFNAAKPVTSDNVHPLYKGKKSQIWDAIPLMNVKRVFILLGMNDISILGLEGARDQYKEVIDKIVEASPDIEIHIISTTYTLKGEGKGKLNNDNLAKYNVLLQEMAEENDWGYIDIATAISDGNGNLAKEYCSDGFVHLSSAAYDVWETQLREYANNAQLLEEETETTDSKIENSKTEDSKLEKDKNTVTDTKKNAEDSSEIKSGNVTDQKSTQKTTKEQENALSKY